MQPFYVRSSTLAPHDASATSHMMQVNAGHRCTCTLSQNGVIRLCAAAIVVPNMEVTGDVLGRRQISEITS